MTALGPKSQRRSVRLIGNGLALTAFLVCVTCLILPRISPYKVLLSPSAFLLVAAGLFAPGLLLRRGGPVWSRSILQRSASIVVALAGAISRVVDRHPLLDAPRGDVRTRRGLARARRDRHRSADLRRGIEQSRVLRGQEHAAADGCRGGPCHLSRSSVRAARDRACDPRGQPARGRDVFRHRAGAPVGSRRDAVVPAGRNAHLTLGRPVSALVGLAVALAYGRSRIVRQFLTALAPAALVVPAVFLLDPGVEQTFLPSESAAAVQTIERTPPIVFVVFDELPLNSLLNADGNIDAERYPNFAALAREAYWFRNASTVAATTSHAVPAILSGRYPTAREAAPTLRYYPVNLFTTLARHYDIFASLRFQKLCPPRACQYNSAMPADTVRSLLSDLGLVWLHIVLPQTLTEELPPVTDDWAEFGRTRETQDGEIRNSRGGVFAQFLSSIDGQPARLHFIHSMLPHMPFEYVPSGRRYRRSRLPDHIYRGKRLFEGMSAAYADTLHQRHLAQVGFVDRLLGDLIGRLREVGVYDEALVIITADHGASYREGRARRQLQRSAISPTSFGCRS